MPFVDSNHRENPDMRVPGDRCYMEYKGIMARWDAEPRWTTVDAIAENLFPNPIKRAYFLAFLVFFQLHVLPYEKRQQWKNGDVR